MYLICYKSTYLNSHLYVAGALCGDVAETLTVAELFCLVVTLRWDVA